MHFWSDVSPELRACLFPSVEIAGETFEVVCNGGAVSVPIAQPGTYPSTALKPQSFWAPLAYGSGCFDSDCITNFNIDALTTAWVLQPSPSERSVTVSTCGATSDTTLLTVWTLSGAGELDGC